MKTRLVITACATISAFASSSSTQVRAWTTNAPYEADRTCCYLQHGPFYPPTQIAPRPVPMFRHGDDNHPFEDRTTECVTQDLGDLLVTQCD